MRYRFKTDESIERGFHRIVGHQFDIAIASLASPDISSGGVHDCRKALKRLKALVRLVEGGLGREKAVKRVKALSAIGRLLSDRRDREVLVETIDKLLPRSSEGHGDALRRLRREITDPNRGQLVLTSGWKEEIATRLKREAKRFSRLRFRNGGRSAFAGGLEKSYRAARKALKKAYKGGTVEDFHSLRKAVQWQWRQMSLLSRAWPEEFLARASAARELSQVLGDDHDFALLTATAHASPELSEAEKEMVAALCERQQVGLRSDARTRAALLLAERPKQFSKRTMAYWRAGSLMAANADEGDAGNGPSRSFSVVSAPTVVATNLSSAAPSRSGG